MATFCTHGRDTCRRAICTGNLKLKRKFLALPRKCRQDSNINRTFYANIQPYSHMSHSGLIRARQQSCQGIFSEGEMSSWRVHQLQSGWDFAYLPTFWLFISSLSFVMDQPKSFLLHAENHRLQEMISSLRRGLQHLKDKISSKEFTGLIP